MVSSQDPNFRDWWNSCLNGSSLHSNKLQEMTNLLRSSKDISLGMEPFEAFTNLSSHICNKLTVFDKTLHDFIAAFADHVLGSSEGASSILEQTFSIWSAQLSATKEWDPSVCKLLHLTLLMLEHSPPKLIDPTSLPNWLTDFVSLLLTWLQTKKLTPSPTLFYFTAAILRVITSRLLINRHDNDCPSLSWLHHLVLAKATTTNGSDASSSTSNTSHLFVLLMTRVIVELRLTLVLSNSATAAANGSSKENGNSSILPIVFHLDPVDFDRQKLIVCLDLFDLGVAELMRTDVEVVEEEDPAQPSMLDSLLDQDVQNLWLQFNDCCPDFHAFFVNLSKRNGSVLTISETDANGTEVEIEANSSTTSQSQWNSQLIPTDLLDQQPPLSNDGCSSTSLCSELLAVLVKTYVHWLLLYFTTHFANSGNGHSSSSSSESDDQRSRSSSATKGNHQRTALRDKLHSYLTPLARPIQALVLTYFVTPETLVNPSLVPIANSSPHIDPLISYLVSLLRLTGDHPDGQCSPLKCRLHHLTKWPLVVDRLCQWLERQLEYLCSQANQKLAPPLPPEWTNCLLLSLDVLELMNRLMWPTNECLVDEETSLSNTIVKQGQLQWLSHLFELSGRLVNSKLSSALFTKKSAPGLSFIIEASISTLNALLIATSLHRSEPEQVVEKEEGSTNGSSPELADLATVEPKRFLSISLVLLQRVGRVKTNLVQPFRMKTFYSVLPGVNPHGREGCQFSQRPFFLLKLHQDMYKWSPSIESQYVDDRRAK